MEALQAIRPDQARSSSCLHMLAAHGLYVHSLPGRLRLELPGLLGNPLLAQAMELSLLRAEGIRRARASAETGRLLVEYDPQLDIVEVVGALERLGYLSGCGHDCHANHFCSPNSLVEVALQKALKLGIQLTLGI